MGVKENIENIKNNIPENVTLVAVSKTKPVEAILEAYDAGQRHFGENKVQELVDKYEVLPKDIQWHAIGHLQTNKVKYIAPFVQLIHAVDSLKLLQKINEQALKNNRTIHCLLQVRIAEEDSKFGLSFDETTDILNNHLNNLRNVKIVGLMGMATFTDNTSKIENEFSGLNDFYESLKSQYSDFNVLSMGMSGDYQIAIENGSNMVRVGSSIFGERNYI